MIFLRNCILVLLVQAVSNCRTVETSVPSREIQLLLQKSNHRNPSVYISEGAGKFRKIAPAKDSTYRFKTPPMDGGYSHFLFFRYNVHHPNEYEIIQIRENEKVLKELSLKKIELLNKNENGFSIIEIDE